MIIQHLSQMATVYWKKSIERIEGIEIWIFKRIGHYREYKEAEKYAIKQNMKDSVAINLWRKSGQGISKFIRDFTLDYKYVKHRMYFVGMPYVSDDIEIYIDDPPLYA